MKFVIPALIGTLLMTPAWACDGLVPGSAAPELRLQLENLQPAIAQAVRETVSQGSREYDVPFHVMGLTESFVLEHDGDPHGSACSDSHNQGDLSNRWCHAAVVKVVDRTLQDMGIRKEISALLAASVFLPKEYLIDLHPSKSDLVIADYEVFDSGKARNTNVAVTVFGDGAVFISLRKKF